MTGTNRLATIGGVALLSGIAMMIALHQFGTGHFATASMDTPWTHPLMHGRAKWAGP